MTRPRIVFMGTPAFAVPSLAALFDIGDVVAVVTQPDKPKGRGQALAISPVKAYALERGVPVLQPQKLRTPPFSAELRELAPDVAVVTAYGKILPDWLLAHVPDDIELQHAALACCGLGPGFNALQRMGVNSLDTLLVSGCGPVGLGSIIQGIVRGARVLAVETHPYRSELARKLGAERVFNPLVEDVVNLVRVETQGKGVDAAIDTSGAPTAAGTLARSLRARGRLSFVSWG